MKVIVLGAGVVGTASAWFLNQAGHDVTVIDRQAGAARETSFANGGQISVSHAEPWANPAAPRKLLKWLGREDAPLLYRFRADWLQWKWGIQFLRECSATRTAANMRQIVSLADYSRRVLQTVRADTMIDYDCATRGILHFYTDPDEFEHASRTARLIREYGCPRETVSTDQVIAIEPALAHMRDRIVGGDFTATDESGDACKFAEGLAARAAESGVAFEFNACVTRLIPHGAGATSTIGAVELIDGHGRHRTVHADAFVLAMGSFSAELARPLGIDLLIYPGKGYSATFDVIAPEAAPMVSLTDDAHKLVISRLGNRLRVAGTCEFNGYARTLNETRCEAVTRRAQALFPGACNYDAPNYWTGLRPLTPSNVPYIGKTRYRNLYLNTGHGTLGWTMACGSGQAIADIVSGRKPEVDFHFLS